MIKVRLHGTVEEITRFMELMRQIETVEAITILSESDLYKDRGKSMYNRLYMDVEVLQVPQTLRQYRASDTYIEEKSKATQQLKLGDSAL